jgi:hypothetical protein
MAEPDFKYLPNPRTDPENKRVGGADINYAYSVMDGTHLTDRLQIKNIEGRQMLSGFDWLIQGDVGGSTRAYNLATGELEFTGTQLYPTMQYVLETVAGTPPAASSPILKIALNGTIECRTRGCILNRSCVVDGLGSAVVKRVLSYTGDAAGIFRLHCSDITIRNLTIEDGVVYTQAQLDAYIAPGVSPDEMQSQGIFASQPTPGCENWLFENLLMKNIHHHTINISRTVPIYTRNIIIRNVVVDNLTGQDFGDSCFNIGVGAENVRIINCQFLQPHHGPIDVWAAKPPVIIIGCYIYCPRRDIDGRTQNGISITAVSDAGDINPTEEVVVRDNYMFGDAITQDCINVHGGSANILIEGNHCEQSNTTEGRFGIRVGGFNVFRDGSNVTIYAKEVLIRNNFIHNSYGAGISVRTDSTIPFSGVSIIGNQIRDTRGPTAIDVNGDIIHVLIADNQIYKTNARLSTNPVGSGIRIQNNCPNTMIIGNHMFLDANATYSIDESGGGTTNNTQILFNQVHSGKAVLLTAANSVVSRNDGYKTEGSGTASITTATATSINVNHGLNYTPSIHHIRLIPINSMGNSRKYWPSSPTSSQFTINVNVGPGSGNTADFAWAIRRRG